jgi:hypothetical protein
MFSQLHRLRRRSYRTLLLIQPLHTLAWGTAITATTTRPASAVTSVV